MTKQIKQRLPLIFQSDELISIREGAVPVLYLGTNAHTYMVARVAMAINCLRSGCPAVQMLWAGNLAVGDDLKTFFLEMERPGESFTFSPTAFRFTSMLLVERLPRD